MAREIKFRALYKGKWYYSDSYACAKALGVKLGESIPGKFWSMFTGHKTLTEYTGRNDVKNIPVYEGDLVKIANTVYHVYWKSEECAFKLIHAKGQGDNYGVFTRNVLNEPWEIIGNIFQNPELLTP